MMRDIKFQFLYKGLPYSSKNDGFNWHKKVYTLNQLIEKTLSQLSDVHEPCKLIAKRQYTGLKVFDEIEVFEGDKMSFVVFDCFGNDKRYEGYVVYDGSRFMLWSQPNSEFYGDDGGFDLDWVLAQDDEAKITGNIYQPLTNKEL